MGITLLLALGTVAQTPWGHSLEAFTIACAFGIAVFAGLAACLVLATRSRSAVHSHDHVPVVALQDLVTWHDALGDVVNASAAEVFLGASPRCLHGDGLLARVHVSDRPGFLRALSDASHGTDTVVVAFRLHVGDDDASVRQVVWAEMRARRLPEADAVRAGAAVIAFTRDISAQRQHGEDVDDARREAERANELKSRFLATVTHELRTPLNAIIGFSELLSADHPFVVTEERRKEYAHIIRSSGHHLLEIVNTLLDMSKIESGNFSFESEPFSFGELASSACDLMQLKADQAGIRLDRRIAAGLPDLPGDRRACRQILINLISNAVKFTPVSGTVTVAVSESLEALSIVVSDTGIGIPADDLPRLGNPFFQSGDMHRRHHEGTGLGLSVVRGLVGLHQGEMTIDSGPGLGTAVTITLPLLPEAAPVRTAPVAVRTKIRHTAQVLERMSA